MAIIFQPQGTGTPHKDGSILVQSPKASADKLGQNYKIDYWPHATTGVDTGVINQKYSGRFDDPQYYTS